MTDLALAVDIGGTKMAAGLVHADGTVQSHRTVPTPREGDAEQVWQPLADLLKEVSAGVKLKGVGAGSAGPADRSRGEVSPVNIPSWRGFPLRARLSEAVPGVPVALAGDGVCAAAGEHWRGAGQGQANLLVMVVSTGVGGGLVLGGRLVQGPSGNAGHIGHIVIDMEGDPCACGGNGCVEAYASGPNMARWALANGWCADKGGGPAVEKSALELAASAREGDSIALQAFSRAGHAIAAGIVSTAALCDLSHVVIGGGVSRAADLLLPAVSEHMAGHARLGFLRDIHVTTAALGGLAGLVGAAALIHEPARYN
jgi:glucokinase